MLLYSNHPHFVGFSTEQPQSFDLYADELQMLAEYAATTDKKEMLAILKRLAEYGQAKAARNRGPVHFSYK